MTYGTSGGWRPGAGRKPSRKKKRRVPHRRRPVLTGRHPVHVTLTVRSEYRSLRTKRRAQVVRAAFVAACAGDGSRIIDWSIQGNHIHVIAQARDTSALSRGMQGFSVRVAKGVNKLLGRRGSVFSERYHVRILKSPREASAARHRC